MERDRYERGWTGYDCDDCPLRGLLPDVRGLRVYQDGDMENGNVFKRSDGISLLRAGAASGIPYGN